MPSLLGLWSLSLIYCNKCWTRQPEWSVAQRSLTVVWHSYYMPTFTGLTCLSMSRTNSAWWCADARTVLIHSIWKCTGQQSPRLHHDSTFVRLLVINWQCRNISGSHTVVGRLLLLARQHGTHCPNAFIIPVLVFLFLAVFSKHFLFSEY